MKTKIVLALMVLTIAGCETSQSSMPPPPATVAYALNQKETEAVILGLKAALKDPDSAKFGEMKASDAGAGVKYVCGLVNARNSFGGYTGNSPFVGVLGSMMAEGKTLAVFRVTKIGSTADDASIVVKMCGHYGVI